MLILLQWIVISIQAHSKAEITGGGAQANWPSQSHPPHPSQNTNVNKNSCQIGTNTVHNATVCVDFVKKHTFMGHLSLKICQKAASCLLFRQQECWQHSPDLKHFKKVSLKLQGLLKFKHFDSQVTNFGLVLPNSHKRLKNNSRSNAQTN